MLSSNAAAVSDEDHAAPAARSAARSVSVQADASVEAASSASLVPAGIPVIAASTVATTAARRSSSHCANAASNWHDDDAAAPIRVPMAALSRPSMDSFNSRTSRLLRRRPVEASCATLCSTRVEAAGGTQSAPAPSIFSWVAASTK